MLKTKWYSELASRIDARNRCYETGNSWYKKHDEVIDQLIDLLPHGSGVDGKTELVLEKCKPYDKPVNRIVIASSYHYMNDMGYYDGWYDFELIITPDFHGVDVKIKGAFGRNSDIKDYLFDYFYYAITAEIQTTVMGQGTDSEMYIRFAEEQDKYVVTE